VIENEFIIINQTKMLPLKQVIQEKSLIDKIREERKKN
jgi:hypothetical protein